MGKAEIQCTMMDRYLFIPREIQGLCSNKKRAGILAPTRIQDRIFFSFFLFFWNGNEIGKNEKHILEDRLCWHNVPGGHGMLFFFHVTFDRTGWAWDKRDRLRLPVEIFKLWENLPRQSQRGWDTSSELNRSKMGGNMKKNNLRREGEGDAHYGYELRPLLSTVFWVQEIVSWICRWQETNMKHLLCF